MSSAIPWGAVVMVVVGASCGPSTQVSDSPGPVASPPASQQPASASTAAKRPNILFIISDDHSAPDLGCYGNAAITSPNLDQLCARGIRFDRAYVSSPQCSPSRTAIVTGRSPHAIGTSRLHAPLRGHGTIMGALRNAGYYTGAYRKLHIGDEAEAQFDFRGGNEDSFATFFERRPTDRPFFLHIGFDDPHRPYEDGAFDPPHDPANVVVPGFLPDTPAVRRDLTHYYDEIARMDSEVGTILELLEQHDVADNTLIIFAGDNGMPFPGAKGSLHEPGIKVPLFVVWSGHIAAGQVSDQLVSLVDLVPTWLEAAGIEPFGPLEGRSLLPLARGEQVAPRPAVFSERNWHDNLDLVRAAIGKRYKLIYNYLADRPYQPTLDLEESPSWQALVRLKSKNQLAPALRRRYFQPRREQIELYDLETDPGETTNLANRDEHAATLSEMKQLLTEWMRQTNDPLPPPLGEYPASHE